MTSKIKRTTPTNRVVKKQKQQEPKQMHTQKKEMETHHVLIHTFYVLITIYAIYLSMERNNGFEPVSFLCALFFAPVYILYAWIVPVTEGSGGDFVYCGIAGLILFVVSICWWWDRRNMRCAVSLENGICHQASLWKGIVSFFFAFFMPIVYIVYAMCVRKPIGMV